MFSFEIMITYPLQVINYRGNIDIIKMRQRNTQGWQSLEWKMGLFRYENKLK